MRLWLGAAFAGVSLITAAAVYLFVDDSSGRTLQSESADLAVGKTSSLADSLAKVDKLAGRERARLRQHRDLRGLGGEPARQSLCARAGYGRPCRSPAAGDEAVRVALEGRRYRAALPGNLTVAAAPIFGERYVRGSGDRPGRAAARAHPRLRPAPRRPSPGAADRDRNRDPGRLHRLVVDRDPREAPGSIGRADGGGEVRRIAAGGWSDEIGDLTRSLDTMREELRHTFSMLATERDRLSAIFAGLTEAVIVVGEDGEVRFTNPAAGQPRPQRSARRRR